MHDTSYAASARIFLMGWIKGSGPYYPHILRFRYFNRHEIAAKKAVELACLCQEWTRTLYNDCEFWQVASNRWFDGYQTCPIRMVDTGIQAQYLKAIPI